MRSRWKAVAVHHGTSANGGCEDCWKVPNRHCCLWNEPSDRIFEHRRSLARDGRERAEVRSICEVGVLDRIMSWGEWETLLYAAEECASLNGS